MKFDSFQGLENLKNSLGEDNKIEQNNGQLSIDKLRKEILSFIDENRVYLDKIDQKEAETLKAVSLGALKKIKSKLEEHLSNTDKAKYEKVEDLRQKMFKLISEKNIQVDATFMKQIAIQNNINSLKYLLCQLKEKYNLNEQDIENTISSVRSIPGGLFGLGKNRKH